MVNTEIRWLYSLQQKMEKLYTVSKNKTRSWLWLGSWTPYCQIITNGSCYYHAMSKRGIEMSPEANILCILYIFLLFMEFVASSCPVLIPTLKIPFGERVTKIPYTSVWISCYDLPHGYLHAQFSSVLSLSRARLFVTPWTTAHQASLSITNS